MTALVRFEDDITGLAIGFVGIARIEGQLIEDCESNVVAIVAILVMVLNV